MNEEDFRNLMEMVAAERRKVRTPEEALQMLVQAGIFDEQGNYTAPYKILEKYTASK